MRQSFQYGFTLIEVVLGGLTLAIAIAAIMGAYVGQVALSEHARNLSLAIQDANRIIEQIRQSGASCGTNPQIATTWPSGTDWDNWLTVAGGGKSIQPDPLNNERVNVTCQNNQSSAVVSCNSTGGIDPIRVTVATCWRHRGRTIGECTPTGVLAASDNNSNGIIESPAMLTTLVTCRG